MPAGEKVQSAVTREQGHFQPTQADTLTSQHASKIGAAGRESSPRRSGTSPVAHGRATFWLAMWTLLAIAVGALTTFGLLALGHEYARARKNFEATTTDEPEQFRGFHMVPPWRKFSGRR